METVTMTMERGENLYDYLERRERELANQLVFFRTEVARREMELAHIQAAKRQIGNLGANDKARFGPPAEQPQGASTEGRSASDEQPTIKDMAMRAMWDGFRKSGATTGVLRGFIEDVFHRQVEITSFSPQLTRLKADNLLKQKEITTVNGKETRWFLTKPGAQRMQELYGPPQELSGPPMVLPAKETEKT